MICPLSKEGTIVDTFPPRAVEGNTVT